ncbi:MAG: dihydropteroate synthase [Promethearchaeota archaeon]
MPSLTAYLGNVPVGDGHPIVSIGIINLDPYSFYSPSSYPSLQKAVSAAEKMIEEGVEILDIGGASTAPGASPVSIDEEIRRVQPVIKQISQKWAIPLSIDTQRTQVAKVALTNGATIVNDVSGLKSDSAMAAVIKDTGASCIVMASKSQPGDQLKIPAIVSALRESLHIARTAEISNSSLVVDPGLGFGKPFGCDVEIIRNLKALRTLDRPILVGVSRKNFIGQVLGYESPDDRLFGSLAVSTVVILKGAHVLRTHDVRATKDCIRMVAALQSPQECE